MSNSAPKEWIFLKLLLPYLVGIVIGIAFPFYQMLWVVGIVLGVLSLLLFAAHRLHNTLPDKHTLQWSLILYGWIGFVGLLNTHWSNPILHARHYSHTAATPGVVLVTLDDQPKAKNLTYQVIATVKGKINGDSLIPLNGKVMLQLPIDSAAGLLQYGDELAIDAKFSPIAPPYNPYEFDYQQYLAHKHIHYQLAPKAERWMATGNNTANWFYTWLDSVRHNALTILQSHLDKPEHYGVAAAMLLGYREGIDTVTLQRYTITGSMHVLSVSGMHVAFIYLILWVVLEPLKRLKWMWPRLAFILVAIWFYAALTEMSPPAVRAAVMFSLFALGETIKRKPNTLNILAASALLILLWEPMQLVDVGFQLSYLAIVGIVFLYRPVYNLWPIKTKSLRFLWQGTCVSIAAQLATLPLILYYFHQLPAYSLLANVGMLLLTPLVMFAGVAILVLNSIPSLGWLLGKILFASLWLMDEMLAFVASLPNAAWKAFYPTTIEMLLLFAMLFSIVAATRMRLVRPTIVTMGLLVLYLGVTNYRLYTQKKQQQLVIYQYYKHTAIGSLQGQTAHIWIDSLALADTVKMERSIYPYLHANGAKTPHIHQLEKPKSNRYGMVGNKRFALLQKYTRRNLPAQRLEVEYLIIGGNPSINMLQIQRVYKAGHIIIDGSNNAKAAERWMCECKVLGLDCHHTRNGAFIASW